MKSSLQTELDSYFSLLTKSLVPVRHVTKAAFCKARKKFSYQAFCDLNLQMTSYVNQHLALHTWNGFRLLAVDGTTLQVPQNDDNESHFGGQSGCPLARVSQCYDLLNRITLDAAIHPYRIDERELATHHAPALQSGDLILLDRGDPAFWFLAWLLSESVQFCARVDLSSWKQVQDFEHSGESERIITLHPTNPSKQKCRHYEVPETPIRVRLIRVPVSSDEVHILMTSLLDSQLYPSSLFSDLYHLRWGIEEHYKLMKSRLQMENFTGKSVESVYQDFHARILALNLTTIMTHPVQGTIKKETRDKKHEYQVNFASALSYMKNNIVLLFQRDRPHRLIHQLLSLLQKTIEPIRPDRSFPRKKIFRDHPVYLPTYKPPA